MNRTDTINLYTTMLSTLAHIGMIKNLVVDLDKCASCGLLPQNRKGFSFKPKIEQAELIALKYINICVQSMAMENAEEELILDDTDYVTAPQYAKKYVTNVLSTISGGSHTELKMFVYSNIISLMCDSTKCSVYRMFYKTKYNDLYTALNNLAKYATDISNKIETMFCKLIDITPDNNILNNDIRVKIDTAINGIYYRLDEFDNCKCKIDKGIFQSPYANVMTHEEIMDYLRERLDLSKMDFGNLTLTSYVPLKQLAS